MNYEKAYKEALERAKIWQEHLYEVGDKDYADELNYIFPELKESEDEKIRKTLIEYFNAYPKDYFGGLKKSYIVAWLEKQDGKYSGGTSKEWTINDAAILKELIDFLENGTAKLQHDLTRYANWLKIQFTPIEKKSEQKTSVIDFKAKDWYVSKVDGKIYNAKFMEKTPINQARKLEIEKAAMSATGIIEQEEWFIKGAEWSDKNPSYISSDKSVKVKGFVAVDNCGDKTIYNPTGRRVAFFPKKPVRDLLTNNHYWVAHISPYDVINLGYEDFPELKWEDEPVEVEITINKVMEAKVIIEINGVRHYMVRGRNNVDPCSKCSLEKHCTKIIGSPCLSPYDYFKKVEE